MERLRETGIVRRLMTMCTICCRTSKLGQIRCSLQIWDRGRMTYCTGVVMNVYNHIRVCMTACCTISVIGDRRIIQPTRRVRCMVVVTMSCAGLIGMTVGTGVARTGCYHAGYCAGRRVVMLTGNTVICVTRITVTGLVVMQRDNLAPGADRVMTGGTTGAVGYLVNRTTVISYVMTGGRRMRRMAVKVSCMTVRAGTLDNRGCVGAR